MKETINWASSIVHSIITSSSSIVHSLSLHVDSIAKSFVNHFKIKTQSQQLLWQSRNIAFNPRFRKWTKNIESVTSFVKSFRPNSYNCFPLFLFIKLPMSLPSLLSMQISILLFPNLEGWISTVELHGAVGLS